MTNRVKGILNGEFMIDRYGNVRVHDDKYGNEIGHLQGWYPNAAKEIRGESEEAYRIARNFLENFIIDMRDFVATIREEDIVRLEDGTWTPTTPFPTGERYPCYQFVVEITDDRYAKYFDEYRGKKYLVLMSGTFFNCKPESYFNENTCKKYGVKTFLDWQEEMVTLRCFLDGHYIRRNNEEDAGVIRRMDGEAQRIRDGYSERISSLKKQIEELEVEMYDEVEKSNKEFVKELPLATPEYDTEGFEETKKMLLDMGEKVCEERF